VNSGPFPAPAGSVVAGGNDYVYLGAGLGGGLLLWVGVTAIVLRKRDRARPVARSGP
jgi:hypothetical protein